MRRYRSGFRLVLLAPMLAATIGFAQASIDPAMPTGPAQSLQELLARTLEQDPQLLVSKALAGVGEQRRAQALSRLAPVLGAQATYGKSQDTVFGVPVDGSTERSAASLRWNLFNAGIDLAEIKGSTQDLAAARQDVRRAREEISERIAQAYAELRRHEELLPFSQARMREAKRLVDQVARANELGKLADADARQATAVYLDAQVAHGQLLADLRSAQERMSILTDAPLRPTQPVHLPASYLAGDPQATGAAGIVAAAQLRADAAQQRVLPWLSTVAPRVDLEYNHQFNNHTIPTTDPQQLRGWQVTARWDLPLGGENQARRAEGVLRAEAAKAEAERVARTVQAELATLPPRMIQGEEAIHQLNDQIAQYDELVRTGELQFQAGRKSLVQLVQLLDSRFVAQQRRAEERYKLLTACMRYLALRGDFLPAMGLATE
jgi:outer membrane protein TolC